MTTERKSLKQIFQQIFCIFRNQNNILQSIYKPLAALRLSIKPGFVRLTSEDILQHSVCKEEVKTLQASFPCVSYVNVCVNDCVCCQSERRAAQRLFAQACETLSQSVSLSLQHDLPHLLPRICSDLLECHGQFDRGSSGQYLTLLQVCLTVKDSLKNEVLSSFTQSHRIQKKCDRNQIFSRMFKLLFSI